MGAIVRQVARVGQAICWYTRELMGDTAYQHYLARFAVDHDDDCQPLTEKEFWHRRIDDAPLDARCC